MAIKIKLTKSVSGSSKDQVAAVRGLGLGKLNSERILKDTPAIRGMVGKVRHLLTVEDVPGDAPKRDRTKKAAKSA
jgi:large subunit ribosomal protein L30